MAMRLSRTLLGRPIIIFRDFAGVILDYVFRMKTCNHWALLVVLVCAGQSVSAQTSRTESPVIISLRSYGWEPSDRLDHSRPLIAVDHEGRTVVGFTVRQRTGLVTRSQPSLDFHIVRFSPNGKVDLSLSLPTHVKGRNGIYLSAADQIIARANDNPQFLHFEFDLSPDGCRLATLEDDAVRLFDLDCAAKP
jgi:hypothetical protein